MCDDALISITPDRWNPGVWEVNGKFDLTLEQATAEVLRQMDEFVFVPQPPRGPLTEGEKRILKLLQQDPYARLLESKPFEMSG